MLEWEKFSRFKYDWFPTITKELFDCKPNKLGWSINVIN